MAAMSIPVFWYMLFDEDSLTLGLGKGDGDNPDYGYLHFTTPTKEGLARAEGRWPMVNRILGSEVTPLFRSWVAFLRKKAKTYIHCETAEWYWMSGDHRKFKQQLCTCLAAFDRIPKRVKAGAIPNRWWGLLLAQAHVSEQAGQLKPLGNLSYCGFGNNRKVPWSVDWQEPCGTMAADKATTGELA